MELQDKKEIVTSYEVLDGNRISGKTTERILHEAVDTVVTRGKDSVNKEELSKQLAFSSGCKILQFTLINPTSSYKQLRIWLRQFIKLRLVKMK